VLLAYQPVGPNAARLAALARTYSKTRFSCVLDNPGTADALADAARSAGVTLGVLIDLELDTGRTGIPPGPGAAALYGHLARAPGLRPEGLHVYDGHLRSRDPVELGRQLEAAYAPIWRLRDELRAQGLPVPAVVAGGTPTFPLLARRGDVELGAGTTVLWDVNSADQFPYLDFIQAALVFTRVVSRPAPNRLCLDLGHKAIASEMPQPRVRLIGLEEATFSRHNEEHLVAETPRAGEFPPGSAFYGIPRHICPTVALYDRAVIVRDGWAVETWTIAARARTLTI
jgi:D-serine deaminase-like pyridoxal phosphate-dependent protein